MAMTWTTNKPTQPGWYKWRRYKGKKVYKVEVRRGDRCLEVWWNGEIIAKFDQPVDGEWAVPTRKEELKQAAHTTVRAMVADGVKSEYHVFKTLQQVEREVWSKVNARMAMVVEDKEQWLCPQHTIKGLQNNAGETVSGYLHNKELG